MRHTMVLPRSELTAQTLPGSWGWKGRGPAGHRAGPCVSGTGMVWEGIPDRRAHCRCPQGRPVFRVPGCWPLAAPVLRQAGKQGQQWLLLGALVRHSGSPPSRVPALASVLPTCARPGPTGLLHPRHRRHLGDRCPGLGSPHPCSGLHSQPVLCRGVRSFDGYRVTHAHCPP